MKQEIKKMWTSSILSALGFILLGLFLLFKPETTISMISYIIGTIILLIGAFALIRFFKNRTTNSLLSFDLMYGIICGVAGFVLILNPSALASLIPFVLGIFIVVSSALKVQYALLLKQKDNKMWITTLILSFVTLVCGVVLIFNPFEGALVITQVIGTFIIIYALLDVIECYIIKKNLKPLEKIVEAEYEEIKVIETKETKKKEKKQKKKDEN